MACNKYNMHLLLNSSYLLSAYNFNSKSHGLKSGKIGNSTNLKKLWNEEAQTILIEPMDDTQVFSQKSLKEFESGIIFLFYFLF